MLYLPKFAFALAEPPNPAEKPIPAPTELPPPAFPPKLIPKFIINNIYLSKFHINNKAVYYF